MLDEMASSGLLGSDGSTAGSSRGRAPSAAAATSGSGAAGTSSSSAAAAHRVPIAYHVPNALLSYNRFSGATASTSAATAAAAASSSSATSAATASTSSPNKAPGHRRAPIPHPSGLETLDEVSHVNALHLATGPAPTALGSAALREKAAAAAASGNAGSAAIAADLEKAADEALANMPPCQRCLAMARAEGYDIIAIELANERWKERWERLCLDAGDADMMTPEDHFGGLIRSSSRSGLNLGPSIPGPSALHEAEEWRSAPHFNRAEVNISKVEESEGVLGIVSQWIELDALDEGVRLDSEIALQQEVAYASHIGVSQVILPAPSSDPDRRRYLPDYARAIANCVTAASSASAPPAGSWITLSVRLPVSSPHEFARKVARTRSNNGSASEVVSLQTNSSLGSKTSPDASSVRVEDEWAWETWNVIQQACNYSSRIQVTLDLTCPLPSTAALSRWVSEPVSALFVPSPTFLANAKGFPVLSKASQALFRSLLRKAPAVILSEVDHPPPQHTRGGTSAYLQYIRHLERTAPADGPLDYFAKGYTDWLQAPLQPLMDNLESSTYETFERDPIKYALYEEAVFRALRDRERDGHRLTTIWVCGAGRGPLVTRCLQAARRARTRVKIVALEKNPNALVILQEKQALEWGRDVVDVVFGDMRQKDAPQMPDRADIVVSELLGSFGDNELSPECLDGAMRFLKPSGISIPAAYESFLTPISSAKLHAEVLGHGSNAGTSEDKKLKSAETPYVVMFQAVSFLAAKGGRGSWDAIQPCWAFEHGPEPPTPVIDARGLPLTNSHNVRTSHHTFHIAQAGLCHGFAGYFEASLYQDVIMSIHPDPARNSKDMLSWFPIFFPFKDPLYMPSGAELDVHLWRMSNAKKVWYEWYAEVFLPIPANVLGVVQNSAATVSGSTDTVHGNAGVPGLGGVAMSANNTSESGYSAGPHGSNPGDASFQNAPGTPSLLSVNLPGDSAGANRWSWSSGASGVGHAGGAGGHAGHAPGKTVRVKTGMSALMNPGGRSSWIGL